MSWIPTIGALGVGGATGSILSQYVASTGNRRRVRGDAIAAFRRLDTARWPLSNATGEFNQLRAEFESVAMAANVSRSVIDRYVVLATVCRVLSEADWDESGGNADDAGSIPDDLAHVTRMAGSIVKDCLWHPHRVWFMRSRRLKSIEIAAAQVQSTDAQRLIAFHSVY